MLLAFLVCSMTVWIILVPLMASYEVPILVDEPIAHNPSYDPNNSRKKGLDGKKVPKYLTKKIHGRERKVPFYASILSVTGLMVTFVIAVLRLSPYNTYTPRRVFQAPLLTQTECTQILERAQQAAARNHEMALATLSKDGEGPATITDSDNNDDGTTKDLNAMLLEPVGWQKGRHGSYPTTDLNLVTDPFTKDDRAFIGKILDKRLTPLLARLYGIPEISIRANDMFVVRYDHTEKGQDTHRTSLAKHTDDGDISFNILLSDPATEFEGGGTRFWNRAKGKPFAHAHPTQAGSVLAHSALIHHEGVPITKGTRIILVGFLSVDHVNPFTNEVTGLSWFASWLNLSWTFVKIKEGLSNSHTRLRSSNSDGFSLASPSKDGQKWTDHAYFRALVRDMMFYLRGWGDSFATHALENLVTDDKHEQYLAALDKDYKLNRNRPRSNWWEGQQINIDLDGTIASIWKTRRENAELFDEL